MSAAAIRPRVTLVRNQRFYYWRDDPTPYVSATTALQALSKPALVNAAVKTAAEWTSSNLKTVGDLAKKDRQAAIDLIKSAHRRAWNISAGIGTDIHLYMERRADGTIKAWEPFEVEQDDSSVRLIDPTETRIVKFVEHGELFLDEWKPDFERIESVIYQRKWQHAGRFDWIAQIKGHGRVLGDWKTTKPGRRGHGIYPETVLQLNSYAHAEFIGEPNGTESPMPQVDRILGVNIRDRAYYAVDLGAPSEAAYQAFRAVLAAFRFQEDGDRFIGEPLAPPIGASE